ncbi:MAG: energy-coupling factor transporter transmembrane protein EcfT [Synergistaceae bacterium]|nr:energy-coupling factor transporter transmembrane protein EcfT [Synergistaceae bacterium]
MFLSNINLGQYVPTGSIIHKLDPRAKLFSLLFIISAVFPAKNFFQLTFWTIALVAVVYVSKISWGVLLRSARPIFFLVAVTFGFNLLSAYFTGDVSTASGVPASLFRAVFTSLRLVVLMLFAIMLPLTTAPLELADGLNTLLRPLERFGFPANECAMMIGMALRFIPLLMQETDKIIRAQLSRGARLDQGNLFRRVMAFFPVLIPLFIIIFRRADEIATAMEARGYDGGAGRTRRKPLVWKFNDTAAVIISILAAGSFFII